IGPFLSTQNQRRDGPAPRTCIRHKRSPSKLRAPLYNVANLHSRSVVCPLRNRDAANGSILRVLFRPARGLDSRRIARISVLPLSDVEARARAFSWSCTKGPGSFGRGLYVAQRDRKADSP